MTFAAVIWLILIVVFLMAEAATVSLVSIWFACGSLAALIFSFTGIGLTAQFFIFILTSAALLLLLRPLVRKYFTPRLHRTNVDSVIGSQGYVTQSINNEEPSGQVKLGAMYWTARSTSGAPIAQDTLVQVDRIEGVKVFVSPAKKA